jgi:DNA topoisomerase-1
MAPHPFNTSDLQKEAYRVFRFSPSYTLTIAEKLYINALISYPRTSSQKLPSSINYNKIILGLSKIGYSDVDSNSITRGSKNGSSSPYLEVAIKLLSKKYLSPNEGDKTDPAHPAIYPTGEKAKGRLDDADQLKLFDLIIRRFLATFGEPSISQHTRATILVNDSYIFKVDGKKIIEEGWMHFYKPYNNTNGSSTQFYLLSELHNGDVLNNITVKGTEKFTHPPFRFNQASLLEEMEKEKIGTKSTRSDIISTLFRRNYISNTNGYSSFEKENNRLGPGTAIEATDIGFEIIQSMRKYVPDIVSTSLTRSIEERLERIESGKDKSTSVIEDAIARLREAIISFKQNEIEIGNQITKAVNITRNRKQMILGTWPICGKGYLKIIRSNVTKKRFVGCSNYASGMCRATAALPQKKPIKTTSMICAICGWPIVESVYSSQSKSEWRFCINMQCPSKKV